jgi:uncharacterized alpha-E superfamily protein
MLSRVADSLYWMSRYLERAEHTARLIDVQIHLMLDLSPEAAHARWLRLMQSLSIPIPTNRSMDAYFLADYMTFDASNANSIVSCIASARENARQLREHISSEMWEQINLLFINVKETSIQRIWQAQPHDFFRAVKEGVQLFQGITDSTMNYNEGYQFIQVGRYIERTGTVVRLLDEHYQAFPHTNAAEFNRDFLEWLGLLKSCTAFEAYCKVYTADLRPDHVAEFLILNREFPHSVRFSINQMQEALASLAAHTESRRSKVTTRFAGRLGALVDYGYVDEILSMGVHQFLADVTKQCAQIHDAIYQAYIIYSIEHEFTP